MFGGPLLWENLWNLPPLNDDVLQTSLVAIARVGNSLEATGANTNKQTPRRT